MKPEKVNDVVNARILAMFGDKITTDHISPAGSIKFASPAGGWLSERQVREQDFNQYGTRRGNHEVMMRGTFANIRIKNFMNKGKDGNVLEGGNTMHYPSGEHDVDLRRRHALQGRRRAAGAFSRAPNTATARRATGPPRARCCWAHAPSSRESYERIHRSNLVGMGVLPLTFEAGTTWKSLGLTGDEQVTIEGLEASIKPRQKMEAEITYADGKKKTITLDCRINTQDELEYFNNGGILPYVIRQLAA